MKPMLPRMLRLLLCGKNRLFVFERQPVAWPSRPPSINLYIHLPFCRQICSFCPYVKEIYHPSTSLAYRDALLKELESYRRLWGDVSVKSVYFGGGTPSLTPEIVGETLSWVASNFHLGAEVGVEVHPLDARYSVLESLRDSGVTMVSLGIQTFHDRLLGMLGRNYDGKLAKEACQRLLQVGFATVDIDLMFAMPTQTREEVEADIGDACELGVDQISTYPLMHFSYTPLGRYLRRAKAALPGWRAEREMLQAVVKRALGAGYQRTAVWSFTRPQALRYTSVTRDSFVGIGAGASSLIGDFFTVNTFSVGEYIKAVGKGSPVALATKLDSADKIAYWLFWRCYDLAIDTDTFQSVFGRDLPFHMRGLLALLSLWGLARQKGNTFHLTDPGAYLFHLIEKEYTHAYLETLWQACLREAWPQTVAI